MQANLLSPLYEGEDQHSQSEEGMKQMFQIPEGEASARIIVQEVVQDNQRYVRINQKVIRAFKLVNLRQYHIPVQYLLGLWYFRSLKIQVAPPLLIPRFETQNLVSLMTEKIRQKWQKGSSLKLVDFCCGTGVIGLSLLQQLGQQYHLECVFLDISSKAIKYTKINAQMNSIKEDRYSLIEGDMKEYFYLIDQSNVVMANPPYLPLKQYKTLQKQVRMYEDPRALVSGQEGLDLVIPLAEYLNKEVENRQDLIGGIQFDGQKLNPEFEAKVTDDQYGKRRYLIF